MRKMNVLGLVTVAAVFAMAACEPCLAQERDTPESAGDFASLAAGEGIFAGEPVGVWTNGLAFSAARTNMAALTVIGRAESTVAEGKRITVRRGTFRFPNLGITAASLGQPAYSAFDTGGDWGVAAAADGGGASVVIGTVANIDGDGVWVRVGK